MIFFCCRKTHGEAQSARTSKPSGSTDAESGTEVELAIVLPDDAPALHEPCLEKPSHAGGLLLNEADVSTDQVLSPQQQSSPSMASQPSGEAEEQRKTVLLDVLQGYPVGG